MYESQTYETILADMLAAVPSTVDKREGSIIYDALAPAAAQLAQAYVSLDSVLTLTFASTTNGKWLDQRVSEYGLTRVAATPAVIIGNFNMVVPVGSRFFINGIYYSVNSDAQTTSNGVTTAHLTCETSGTIGNISSGTLVSITNIVGLTTATINGILTNGTDTETDAALYNRFLVKVQAPAVSGNKSQYELWAESVAGVGKAKVFPLWNGPGTVKVIIVDTNYNAPTSTLITSVQNYIDPASGQGTGVAPIGATCTVVGATVQNITVTCTVVLDSTTSQTTAQANVQTAINNYIKSIAFKDNTVRYSKITAAIGTATGVVDYSNVTVNGGTSNIVLTDEQLPVLGTVTVNV